MRKIYKKVLSSISPDSVKNNTHIINLFSLQTDLRQNPSCQFSSDDWLLLDRFLLFAHDSNIYSEAPQAIKPENMLRIAKLLIYAGEKVIKRVTELVAYRLPLNNETAIFIAAMALTIGNPATKQITIDRLPLIVENITQLLIFADFSHHIRGWGRQLRRAIHHWFQVKTTQELFIDIIQKPYYQGWTLADVLKLSHVKINDPDKIYLIDWLVFKKNQHDNIEIDHRFPWIKGYKLIRKTQEIPEVIALIEQYNLPLETIPKTDLRRIKIWEKLIEKLPLKAILENLGLLSKLGVIKSDNPATKLIIRRLLAKDEISNLHPIDIFVALENFLRGKGQLYVGYWSPVWDIYQTLSPAFNLACQYVLPTNKKILLATCVCNNVPSFRRAYGSLGVTTNIAAEIIFTYFSLTEKTSLKLFFDETCYSTNISLEDQDIANYKKVISPTPRITGKINSALPIEYAVKNKIYLDSFIIMIPGNSDKDIIKYPAQAIFEYRKIINSAARVIMVIPQPHNLNKNLVNFDDPLSLIIPCFDSQTLHLITNFMRG